MSDEGWVTYGEGPVAGARELVRTLSQAGIEAQLGPAPKSGCCSGGGCGCSSKVQVLLREGDLVKAQSLMRDAWLDALRAEGTLDQGLPIAPSAPVDAAADSDDLTCPACGTRAPLVEGACSDCGLQLE